MTGALAMMFDVVFWVSSAVCVVSLLHMPIFVAATRWHRTNIGLVFDDHERYESRMAAQPWYVRYSSLLLRRFVNLAAPREPERIRLVDVDGAETPPTSVTYLGVEDGLHVYMAHFPLDTFPWGVPVAQFPRLAVGRLPARTVLRCRFDRDDHGPCIGCGEQTTETWTDADGEGWYRHAACTGARA